MFTSPQIWGRNRGEKVVNDIKVLVIFALTSRQHNASRHPHEERGKKVKKIKHKLYVMQGRGVMKDMISVGGLALNHWFFVLSTVIKKAAELTRELFMHEARKFFATLKRHDSFSTIFRCAIYREKKNYFKEGVGGVFLSFFSSSFW